MTTIRGPCHVLFKFKTKRLHQEVTFLCSKKSYGGLEHGRLVHFAVCRRDHETELVDQHIELVSATLLTQIPRFSESGRI